VEKNKKGKLSDCLKKFIKKRPSIKMQTEYRLNPNHYRKF